MRSNRGCANDALLHASAKFMWIAIDSELWSSDVNHAQQIHALLMSLPPRHVSVKYQRLGNLHTNSKYRIKRCHRVLHNQADTPAPQFPHFLVREVGNTPASEPYVTFDYPPTRRQ
jgi:hypothetical protein